MRSVRGPQFVVHSTPKGYPMNNLQLFFAVVPKAKYLFILPAIAFAIIAL
jgi:hypothetical protein